VPPGSSCLAGQSQLVKFGGQDPGRLKVQEQVASSSLGSRVCTRALPQEVLCRSSSIAEIRPCRTWKQREKRVGCLGTLEALPRAAYRTLSSAALKGHLPDSLNAWLTFLYSSYCHLITKNCKIFMDQTFYPKI
jgi:hypothetical protein